MGAKLLLKVFIYNLVQPILKGLIGHDEKNNIKAFTHGLIPNTAIKFGLVLDKNTRFNKNSVL